MIVLGFAYSLLNHFALVWEWSGHRSCDDPAVIEAQNAAEDAARKAVDEAK